MLEDSGLATTVIGLVRPHMERSANPRGLFVQFPLDRPLGEPGDVPFQKKVLVAALRLLEWDNGRTILENFPQAEPSQRVVLDWQPAFAPRLSTPANPAEWARAVAEELSAALPWWEIARARYGRTAVGVSFQPPEVLPSFAASFLAGEVPAPSEPLGSPALALRFLAADLRAFLAEAAMCNGPLLPPNQWNTCLYWHTMSGRLLVALRAAAQDSSHDGFKTVGTRFLVPTPWLPG